MFENDVKTYGTQTRGNVKKCQSLFENDVKTYGTQTDRKAADALQGLRMM